MPPLCFDSYIFYSFVLHIHFLSYSYIFPLATFLQSYIPKRSIICRCTMYVCYMLYIWWAPIVQSMHELYILTKLGVTVMNSLREIKTYIDVKGHRVDRHGEINEEDRHAWIHQWLCKYLPLGSYACTPRRGRWSPGTLEKYISSVNLLLNFLSYQNSGEKIRYIFLT